MIERYKEEWNRECWFLPDFLLLAGISQEEWNKCPAKEKKALETILKRNRAAIKKEVRERLLASKSWQAQLAVYKIVSSGEEYSKLIGEGEVEEPVEKVIKLRIPGCLE